MSRDTKIAAIVLGSVPLTILIAAVTTTWALANGAPPFIRYAFRILCHGMARRSLKLFDTPMPLCARCVAIYAGLLIGFAVFAMWPRFRARPMRTAMLLAATPMALDGFTQAFALRESTNGLRLATGSVAAVVFAIWVLSVIENREPQEFSRS